VGFVAFFDNLGIVVGAVGTVAGAIGFKRWGWPPLKRAGKSIAAFFRGIARVSELDEKLGKVLKEVLPNGGTSLRDSVNRTETAITVLINTTRAQWDAMGMFAIFEANAEGEYKYINNEFQRWVNHTEGEMLGYGWINSVALQDRDRVRAEWESCVEDVRMFFMEFRLRRADGQEFAVACTASPVTEYAGGPVLKWVGVVRRT
jgi:PAS domain S-box-containing protein